MDEPPTLSTLPAEMQKAVADQLDTTDLTTFRLVSRDMQAAAEDAFLQCHFQKRTHVYSRYGLSRLAEITAQPHLLKKLDQIELAVIDPTTFVESDAALRSEVMDNRLAEKWNAEMSQLVEHDIDIHLLTLIIRHLQFSGRLVSFSITGATDYRYPISATGLSNAEQVLDVEHFQRPSDDYVLHHRYFRGDCSRMIRSLFSSVAITEYPLVDLDLCRDLSHGSLKPKALAGIDKSTFQKLCHSWQALSSLSMGFAWEEGRWYMAQDHGLQKLIASASNITTLSLYSDGQMDNEVSGQDPFADRNPLDWFAAAFANHELQHVELQGFNARSDQFVTFLLEHRETLESVTLQTVSIQPHQCWSEVFRVLAGDLQLNSLLCFTLMRGSTAGEIVSIDEDEALELEEPQAIKQCLDRVLEEGVKYVVWPGHRFQNND
ncbi:hypothetical protein PRZ48_007787 [Zasmidium cellare]|uniref:F-box domain-containing protein n=1 Tax=Zasmidium cellare TaxID=395010 RepID=A0ABR0EK97_ZASCE|nr:hypothetical protein PRZ48_007787 [Zasmidium cellare]